jgi:hypothetical protein
MAGEPEEHEEREPSRGERAFVGAGERVDQVADNGAGVLFGFALWALTMAYLNPSGHGRGGVQGVRDLLKAKFLNKGQSGEWLS